MGSTVKGIGSSGEGSNTVVNHGTDMDIDTGDDFINEMNVKWKHASIDNDTASLVTDTTGPPCTVSSTSLKPMRKKVTSGP